MPYDRTRAEMMRDLHDEMSESVRRQFGMSEEDIAKAIDLENQEQDMTEKAGGVDYLPVTIDLDDVRNGEILFKVQYGRVAGTENEFHSTINGPQWGITVENLRQLYEQIQTYYIGHGSLPRDFER